MTKTALVLGAGGFIGNHLVNRLKSEECWVRGVDLKYPEFSASTADDFILRDLRDARAVKQLIGHAGLEIDSRHADGRRVDADFDEIYQLAADMGGAGYIFTGEHDADVMHNSASINLNVLEAVKQRNIETRRTGTTIFYSSSACIYPEYNQTDPNNPKCSEDSAYPAMPDSEYGWEKLFSERLYFSYNRNYRIPVRVARFHNIFGPYGAWTGGREKAPAAICRKVAVASPGGAIEVWGDGQQTRSFLYIDDCIDAIVALMTSDFPGPVNVGSEDMVTINTLVDIVCEVARKDVTTMNVPGPTGVRGRNSDNALIEKSIGWCPKIPLREGLALTYEWINQQVAGLSAHARADSRDVGSAS